MMTLAEKLATMELKVVALVAERDYWRNRAGVQKDALAVTSGLLKEIDERTDSILCRLDNSEADACLPSETSPL